MSQDHEPMHLAARVGLAIAGFAAVVWIPEHTWGGASGTSSDLGLSQALSQGSALSYVLAFAGGVLTSLTPCVYPLIPITVSLFGVKPGIHRSRAMTLSGLYVLGIASMYSALGAAAALTGSAFGGVMGSPWVMGLVASIFAAMAFSLFGAFELQVPLSLRNWLSHVGGTGPSGAFAMGLVAGLVAAPCTGPVLAAALAYVATQGSLLFGLSIMFTYALGIGLLFFLIGTFSLTLPKSGPWMEAVKGIFGVALLVAAGIFLKNALPGAKTIFLTSHGAVLAAAGATAAGILLGAVQAPFSRSRLESGAKVLGIALTVCGIVYGTGVADARERLATAIHWLQDEQEALNLARTTQRPVIIDFWADWCTACKELDRTVWSDPSVREAAKRFVFVKLDGTSDSPVFQAAVEKYGVVGLPTVVLIDSRGKELPERITGTISGEEMRARLRAVDQICAAPALACVARW